ncbi:MAG: DUF2945 domain-containing protein [Alphaproteobacteria bacterium]|nr:DUF2945 domain-containing protein [Alphaproteobacteria bacterium]
MPESYTLGTEVSWKWGRGNPKGKVVEVYSTTVRKVLKGTEITRKGTPDNPAYFIEQVNGSYVLKLHSELNTQKSSFF